MSESASPNARRPTLFCLHYLGGSAREWSEVARQLGDVVDVVAIDLPGFGDAAQTSGYSVDAMADALTRAIREAAPSRFLIAGHSMGAKVATAVTRAAEDGANDLAGLVGLITVAGSPPAPEPMSDADRAEMLGWFSGDAAQSREQAVRYVEKNAGPRLDPDAEERAVVDVLRANVAAWRAWLERGSREDWSARIGMLRTPTLVVSGADDENLGPDTQARLTAIHFRDVHMVTIPNAKHLLPLEAPRELARAIRSLVVSLGDVGSTRAVAVAGEYGELIASRRVGTATRRALLERLAPDDATYAPMAMDPGAFAILRAVVDRIVPQTEAAKIDLAARLDRALADGSGDGWRFDRLPTDAAAYRIALATLDSASRAHHARPFVEIDDAERDAMLAAMADGSFGSRDGEPNRFGAEQMQAWFEDVRAEVVKAYVAHPRTLARIGYSGIANGGDDLPKSGFVRVGLDDREPWEPMPRAEATR